MREELSRTIADVKHTVENETFMVELCRFNLC